jgi:flagellar motor switch protein FliM
MAEEFLSQEEIDALLGTDKEEEKEVQQDIRPFDFSKVEHIKKGGIPGLEFIITRWLNIFRDEIRKIITNVNSVFQNDIYITRFNDFMLKVPLPASYTIISMSPLKENALIILDSRLVFTVISVLFGGPPKPFKVEGREFTKLEIKIVNDFVDIIIKTFESVWENVYPVKIEKKSIELNPNLAKIVSPSEKVIIVEISIDIDGFEAPFFFCFPQNMFLPIKDFIYSEVTQFEEDKVWKSYLIEKVKKVKLKLWVELFKSNFKVKDILNWKEGTQINTKITPEDTLTVYIENRPKFTGKIGKKKDKFAIKIKDIYRGENDERRK